MYIYSYIYIYIYYFIIHIIILAISFPESGVVDHLKPSILESEPAPHYKIKIHQLAKTCKYCIQESSILGCMQIQS